MRRVTDTHFHIFGPYQEFPLPPDANYAPGEAVAARYLEVAHDLGIERMVVVQGSCYGANNEIVLAAIEALGRGNTRGVAIIDDGFDRKALAVLDARGIRGIRINVISDKTIDEAILRRRAAAIADFGWHIVFHCQSEQLVDFAPTLKELPVDIVVDHFGRIDPRLGLDQPAVAALMDLLATGRGWLKLITYRSASGAAAAMLPFVQRVIEQASNRCLWGTDWPHPLFPGAVDTKALLETFLRHIPSDQQERILWSNPGELYGFD